MATTTQKTSYRKKNKKQTDYSKGVQAKNVKSAQDQLKGKKVIKTGNKTFVTQDQLNQRVTQGEKRYYHGEHEEGRKQHRLTKEEYEMIKGTGGGIPTDAVKDVIKGRKDLGYNRIGGVGGTGGTGGTGTGGGGQAVDNYGQVGGETRPANRGQAYLQEDARNRPNALGHTADQQDFLTGVRTERGVQAPLDTRTLGTQGFIASSIRRHQQSIVQGEKTKFFDGIITGLKSAFEKTLGSVDFAGFSVQKIERGIHGAKSLDAIKQHTTTLSETATQIVEEANGVEMTHEQGMARLEQMEDLLVVLKVEADISASHDVTGFENGDYNGVMLELVKTQGAVSKSKNKLLANARTLDPSLQEAETTGIAQELEGTALSDEFLEDIGTGGTATNNKYVTI
jgi:hypothetical protein